MTEKAPTSYIPDGVRLFTLFCPGCHSGEEPQIGRASASAKALFSSTCRLLSCSRSAMETTNEGRRSTRIHRFAAPDSGNGRRRLRAGQVPEVRRDAHDTFEPGRRQRCVSARDGAAPFAHHERHLRRRQPAGRQRCQGDGDAREGEAGWRHVLRDDADLHLHVALEHSGGELQGPRAAGEHLLRPRGALSPPRIPSSRRCRMFSIARAKAAANGARRTLHRSSVR